MSLRRRVERLERDERRDDDVEIVVELHEVEFDADGRPVDRPLTITFEDDPDDD